ncbi:nucleolar pre-ribosomal-associated protein 2 [Rhypophila decipiens]|uniref:Nucleolar pre-ribosomal-associated protein 2 n=1 Tax=Rhypophila decipiens TaxID=261697 RepID=A0AAN6Y9P8_9PEZI|nr:nucleolar pre-ribosomal-associated protein 2 [Rhypophila decipiens]
MGNDAALIPAVQALDQGDIETAPERLERVWQALAPHREGTAQKGFHAAEEMLLRWLLKMTNGTDNATERFRRYPRTWEIMRIVFDWIPLFSLAKALADRRFIVILQQTLKEISKPEKGGPDTNGDVEMVDADGQKDPDFDLSLQRQKAMCLKTAQALLTALRVLISRCESISVTEPPSRRMGAEHVKSLFYSSAAEAMKLLVPIIVLCGMAAENHEERDGSPLDQASWMSTFSSIWELHLRGPDDAMEVARSLSGFAANLLGKLTGIPEKRSLSIDSAVQSHWAHDLRLFVMRNMILPSRSAFTEKESAGAAQQVMEMAIDMSSLNFKTSFPVLFDLIAKTPRTLGQMTSKKDYETWVQAAFNALISALKPHGVKALPVVESILEMAAEHNVPLSLPTLRDVCKEYALQADGFAWTLLFSTIKLNPDVFLISSEGQELLDRILEKTKNSESMSDEDFDKALQFIVLLAERYAKARDLSTFLKTWLRYLAVGEKKVQLERLWAQPKVVSAVAGVVQDSLNTKQLVDIVDWLATRTSPAEKLGRIHILAAVASGVSSEELVDAVNTKTFNAAFSEKFSKKEPSAISVSRWLIAQNAISRGSLEDIEQIWSTVQSDIKSILKKSTITKEGTFAAFKCAVAAWIANHPGGPHEEEAADMVCAFIKRLDDDTESEKSTPEHPITKGTYVSWILTDDCRLVTLITKRNKQFPDVVLGLLMPKDGAISNSATFEAATAVVSQLLHDENLINDVQVAQGLITKMIEQLDPSQASKTLLARRVAVQFLLGIPDDIFTRPDRQTVMVHLVSPLPETEDLSAEDQIEYWKLALALMRKAMTQPTFYTDMSYDHLEKIGKRLYKLFGQTKEWKSSTGVLVVRDVFVLLGQIADLTIRQMDSGNPEEREKTYLEGAASLLKSSCKESEALTRLVLLHAFIAALQGSPNLEKLEEVSRDVGALKSKLLDEVKVIVELGKWRGKALLSLVIALKATHVLDRQVIRDTFTSATPALIKASKKYLQKNSQVGWEIRMFLARCFAEEMGSPLKLRFLAQETGDGEDDEEGAAPALVDRATLLRYVDVLVRDIDDETKMDYLEDLLGEQSGDPLEESYRLFIIQTLVQHLAVARGAAIISKSGFELAKAHTMLCQKLTETAGKDPEQFALVAETLYILMDQKNVCMIQWNIDNTLSTVASICADLDQSLSQKHVSIDASVVRLLPKTYKYLCALVEIIIKRHRKRIDGHFHLLIPTLQALLRHLLILSPKGKKSSSSTPLEAAKLAHQQRQQERNARLYSRLLTLVCEPTVASVSTRRTQHNNSTNPENTHQPNVMLDVDKDKAKRYAGQFMYLVVMHYIRLQLQLEQTVVVTGESREALETSMFSILDITSKPDGLRILTDAMDSSGRVILRELLRRYERFGRWSGV